MQFKNPHQFYNLIRRYGLPSGQSLSAPDLIWWYRLPSNDASARQSTHRRMDTSGSRFRTSKLQNSLIWWLGFSVTSWLSIVQSPMLLLTHISLATARVHVVAKLPTWWPFSYMPHSAILPQEHPEIAPENEKGRVYSIPLVNLYTCIYCI